MKEKEIAAAVIELCQKLHQQRLISGGDGNVSYRISDDQVLITPSGVPKCEVKPEDMALVDLEGKVLRGRPSSEKWMHLEIYLRCEKAKCVVHAHPPTVVAWSIARPELKELPGECMSEVIPTTGRIPFVPYACPGTTAMAENLRPFLPKCRALILSRHGALTWGEDLQEVLNGMERLEHSALILKTAEDLGGITKLPAEEIAKLKQLREKIGERLL